AFPVAVGPLLFSSGLGQLAAGMMEVAVALLDTGRHVIWNLRWRARNAVAPRVGEPTVHPGEWQVATRAIDALLTELLGSLIWGRFAGMERKKFLQSWGASPIVGSGEGGSVSLGPGKLPVLQFSAAWQPT
ncbi:unnamed protein product, partial [Phaeothamnion confervicola]